MVFNDRSDPGVSWFYFQVAGWWWRFTRFHFIKSHGIHFRDDVLIDGDLGNIGDRQVEERDQHDQKNRYQNHQMVWFQKGEKPFEKSCVI